MVTFYHLSKVFTVGIFFGILHQFSATQLSQPNIKPIQKKCEEKRLSPTLPCEDEMLTQQQTLLKHNFLFLYFFEVIILG